MSDVKKRAKVMKVDSFSVPEEFELHPTGIFPFAGNKGNQPRSSLIDGRKKGLSGKASCKNGK